MPSHAVDCWLTHCLSNFQARPCHSGCRAVLNMNSCDVGSVGKVQTVLALKGTDTQLSYGIAYMVLRSRLQDDDQQPSTWPCNARSDLNLAAEQGHLADPLSPVDRNSTTALTLTSSHWAEACIKVRFPISHPNTVVTKEANRTIISAIAWRKRLHKQAWQSSYWMAIARMAGAIWPRHARCPDRPRLLQSSTIAHPRRCLLSRLRLRPTLRARSRLALRPRRPTSSGPLRRLSSPLPLLSSPLLLLPSSLPPRSSPLPDAPRSPPLSRSLSRSLSLSLSRLLPPPSPSLSPSFRSSTTIVDLRVLPLERDLSASVRPSSALPLGSGPSSSLRQARSCSTLCESSDKDGGRKERGRRQGALKHELASPARCARRGEGQ